MSRSNSLPIRLDSPVELLFSSKKSKTLQSLQSAGVKTVYDLMWVFPLRIEKLPSLQGFSKAVQGQYFRGLGTIIDLQKRPSTGARGKVPLQNITLTIKDYYSNKFLSLRWFNSYPSIVKKIEESSHLVFLGKLQDFNGTSQIVNPEINSITESEIQSLEANDSQELKIQYPTINKMKGFNIKRTIENIPLNLWNEIPELLSTETLKANGFSNISESFQLLHGVNIKHDSSRLESAQRRLIFEEFFLEQTKLMLRKKERKGSTSVPFKEFPEDIFNSFPHPFTEDQKKAYADVCHDLSSKEPMMRLLQGDVGCGKTWVALASSLLAYKNGYQAAIMCPTESLARQHHEESKELFSSLGINISLLLGSTKASEKKEIYENAKEGKIDLIIGTHSLIQTDLHFKNLGIAIIDEQHKFGVDQRIKLVSKTISGHCLIMTATPIPRSLSLTQYGDLDITTIKTIPSSRSGFKTRIVEKENFEKFLSFLKTRLSLGEQAYVVVPAIEDNEEMDIHNLEEVFERFKSFFPKESIHPLHGKLSPSEKEDAFSQFKKGEIQILIATSMVEVGINVTNATIMTILNPERFGLSSLHQLRGRVGRGDKVGFCFLVIDKKLSKEARERLTFIESNADGFDIAEEDLRIRGQGNILGKDQSGSDSFKRLANPIIHYPLLELARNTLYNLSDNPTPQFQEYLEGVSKDSLIHNTI